MDEILPWIVFGLVLGLVGIVAKLSKQLELIRRDVNAIALHLNVAPAGTKLPPEILGLIQAGRKIEAIKVYREATGASLADAKRAVEELET